MKEDDEDFQSLLSKFDPNSLLKLSFSIEFIQIEIEQGALNFFARADRSDFDNGGFELEVLLRAQAVFNFCVAKFFGTVKLWVIFGLGLKFSGKSASLDFVN